MGIATGVASAAHVYSALLPSVARYRLLEGTHVSLIRVRHIVVLLLTQCFATVRSHGPSRGAGDHATRITRVRKRVVASSLVVQCLVLRCSEPAVDALANDLVEAASHLLLR